MAGLVITGTKVRYVRQSDRKGVSRYVCFMRQNAVVEHQKIDGLRVSLLTLKRHLQADTHAVRTLPTHYFGSTKR